MEVCYLRFEDGRAKEVVVSCYWRFLLLPGTHLLRMFSGHLFLRNSTPVPGTSNSCCVGNSYVGGGPDSTPDLQHRGLLLVMGATATLRKPDRGLRIQDKGQVAETSQAAARARRHPGVLACACLCQGEFEITLRPYNLKDRLLGTGADVSETIKGLRRDEGYIVHTFSTALPQVWALRNTCSIYLHRLFFTLLWL